KDGPAQSAADGTVVLGASRVFSDVSAAEPLPLFVVHEGRGLVALGELSPSEFGKIRTRELRLDPACNVTGSISFLGIAQGVEPSAEIAISVRSIGIGPDRPMLGYLSGGRQFSFPLPAGKYLIWAGT